MLKKVLVMAAVAVLTVGYAQAQFKFGVRAGFNLTNLSGKDFNGDKLSGDDKGKFKPGFQIGVVGEYSFSEAFAIQPGILYSQQGTVWKYTDEENDYKDKANLNYIQIPINAIYKIDLGGTKLLLQAGPYLGYGLGGKWKEWKNGDKIDLDSDDSKIKMGGNEDEDLFKAFDFGIGLGAGVQFNSFQVGVGYNIGLVNIEHQEEDSKSTFKNNGLALTLTYMFGK